MIPGLKLALACETRGGKGDGLPLAAGRRLEQEAKEMHVIDE
jgi:hypothetical protein